jgi:hypothetical protein
MTLKLPRGRITRRENPGITRFLAEQGHKRLPRLNAAEEAFAGWLKILDLPQAVRNYRFAPLRKFELDFAWPKLLIGVEIQGGIWRAKGGAHTGLGHLRDMDKNNLAVELGWRVWQFDTDDAKSGRAAQRLEPFLRKAMLRFGA